MSVPEVMPISPMYAGPVHLDLLQMPTEPLVIVALEQSLIKPH